MVAHSIFLLRVYGRLLTTLRNFWCGTKVFVQLKFFIVIIVLLLLLSLTSFSLSCFLFYIANLLFSYSATQPQVWNKILLWSSACSICWCCL